MEIREVNGYRMATSIYIVVHKQVNLPDLKGYTPIVVGNHQVKYKGCVQDNTGNNIAEKNPNYCELTALYWIWKNYSGTDKVGLCHYRRFFTNHKWSMWPTSIQRIGKILEQYDAIVPQTWTCLDYTVEEWFLRGNGRKHDLENLRNVIKRFYPDYLDCYDYVMNGNEAFYYNMFVMPYYLVDEYCKWLFDILFEMEKITDLTGYSSQESRIYGYLSERLFNVWVKKKKIRVKHLPVYETGRFFRILSKTKYYLMHFSG
jgi:hypothetical protein